MGEQTPRLGDTLAVRGYQEGGLAHNRGPRPSDEQINRTVVKLIQQDRPAEEIVAYLNSIEPGLGDRTTNIPESVAYFREQRGLPIVNVKTKVDPSQLTPVEDIPIEAPMRGMSGFDEFALPATRSMAPIFGGGADVLDFLASKIGQYGGYREGLQNRMQNLEDRYAYLGGPSAAPIAGNRASIAPISALSLEGIESVPGAVSRVAPQVFQGAVDYVTDRGISGMLQDAKDAAVGAYEDFTQDPYGSLSGGMFNATLLPPLVNEFANSRAAARQYGEGADYFRGQNAPEYVEEYQGLQDEADALSALSVLGALPIPFAGKIGRAVTPRRRKARGGLAVKRKR